MSQDQVPERFIQSLQGERVGGAMMTMTMSRRKRKKRLGNLAENERQPWNLKHDTGNYQAYLRPPLLVTSCKDVLMLVPHSPRLLWLAGLMRDKTSIKGSLDVIGRKWDTEYSLPVSPFCWSQIRRLKLQSLAKEICTVKAAQTLGFLSSFNFLLIHYCLAQFHASWSCALILSWLKSDQFQFFFNCCSVCPEHCCMLAEAESSDSESPPPSDQSSDWHSSDEDDKPRRKPKKKKKKAPPRPQPHAHHHHHPQTHAHPRYIPIKSLCSS